MDVTAVTSNNAALQPQAAVARSTDGNIVSKDEFLTLFTAQLRYQNPLNPLDSAEFTSQLAQFSSLEQLQGINSQLQNLLVQEKVSQADIGTGLIGKKVHVAGNQIYMKDGAEIPYSLPADASGVKVIVCDASGKQVKEIVAGQQKAGRNSITWDGRDSAGNALPEGTYTFKVEAIDTSGQPLTATTMVAGTVTGVTFRDTDMELIMDDGTTVRLNDILDILQGGS